MKEISQRATAEIKKTAIQKGGQAVELIKEKGSQLGEEAAEKSKELLQKAQEKMGTSPSDSDSLIEQAKETASVAYDAAREKATPYIEQAAPAILKAKEQYVDPALEKGKELAT